MAWTSQSEVWNVTGANDPHSFLADHQARLSCSRWARGLWRDFQAYRGETEGSGMSRQQVSESTSSFLKFCRCYLLSAFLQPSLIKLKINCYSIDNIFSTISITRGNWNSPCVMSRVRPILVGLAGDASVHIRVITRPTLLIISVQRGRWCYLAASKQCSDRYYRFLPRLIVWDVSEWPINNGIPKDAY